MDVSAHDLERFVENCWTRRSSSTPPPARDGSAALRTQPELAPILRKLLGRARNVNPATSCSSCRRSMRAPSARSTPRPRRRFARRPLQTEARDRSGGMADVWLAERADGAFERDVALKLPRLSRLRRDLAARFARERDILARLEHPNIARFYDAGVDRRRPALSGDGVRRRPADHQWCDERTLDIAARLAAVRPSARRRAVRARQSRHSPRSETVEHPRDRRRPGAAARLRHREAPVRRARSRARRNSRSSPAVR